jgi:hypothetical protein
MACLMFAGKTQTAYRASMTPQMVRQQFPVLLLRFVQGVDER